MDPRSWVDRRFTARPILRPSANVAIFSQSRPAISNTVAGVASLRVSLTSFDGAPKRGQVLDGRKAVGRGANFAPNAAIELTFH